MLYQLSYLGIILRAQNDAYCSVISSSVNRKSDRSRSLDS